MRIRVTNAARTEASDTPSPAPTEVGQRSFSSEEETKQLKRQTRQTKHKQAHNKCPGNPALGAQNDTVRTPCRKCALKSSDKVLKKSSPLLAHVLQSVNHFMGDGAPKGSSAINRLPYIENKLCQTDCVCISLYNSERCESCGKSSRLAAVAEPVLDGNKVVFPRLALGFWLWSLENMSCRTIFNTAALQEN